MKRNFCRWLIAIQSIRHKRKTAANIRLNEIAGQRADRKVSGNLLSLAVGSVEQFRPPLR